MTSYLPPNRGMCPGNRQRIICHPVNSHHRAGKEIVLLGDYGPASWPCISGQYDRVTEILQDRLPYVDFLCTMASSMITLFLSLYLALFASAVSAGKVTNPKAVPRNAILLSKVDSLTLYGGRMTKHRRVPAVPQLSCVGLGSVCKLYSVEVMRCTNEGADYDAENIQWACRADLPEEFKLGSTDVACEGYESSDDPYVLKGSCGVEYRLLLTDKGEERFGRQDDYPRDGSEGNSSLLAKVVFFGIFGCVLFIIVTRMLEACSRSPPRLGRGGGRPPWFGGGGGGNDDVDDPPPPYDSHGFAPPRKPRSTNTRTSSGSSSRSGQQEQQGWRAQPWMAGLAGAGLGYALGRGQNRTPTRPAPSRGRFFGDGGGPSNSSPPTFSSSRHSSTGFGGTSRR